MKTTRREALKRAAGVVGAVAGLGTARAVAGPAPVLTPDQARVRAAMHREIARVFSDSSRAYLQGLRGLDYRFRA